jgi:hypothetical protein
MPGKTKEMNSAFFFFAVFAPSPALSSPKGRFNQIFYHEGAKAAK